MLITFYCSYSSLPVMWVKISMCNQLCFMFCWACHDITDVQVAEKNKFSFLQFRRPDSKDQVVGTLVTSEAPLPDLQISDLSLCFHKVIHLP